MNFNKGTVFNLRRNQVPFYIMGQSMGGAVSDGVRLGLEDDLDNVM